MDSPKSTATPAAAANASIVVLSDSPPVQESPFLNYINNLSPIEPVKVAHGAQGFATFSSPPLIFTSPRTLSERGTNFLQRSQLCQISSAIMTKNDHGSKKVVGHSNYLEESVAYCCRLITDTQKDNDVKNSAQGQPGNSSSCVDEYLNDPVDVDCANSVNLINPKAISEQAEEFSQCQSTVETKLGDIEEEKHGEQSSNECQNIKSKLPADHAPEEKQHDGVEPNIILARENYGENVAATAHGGSQNIAKHDMEAGQIQRGLSRRCLQFEEGQCKTPLNSIRSTDLTNNVSGSGLPASTTELGNLDSSHVDLAAYSNNQMVDLSKPVPSMFSSRFSGKSPIVVAKPSGIGLHLNSIVNKVPMSHSAVVCIKSTPTISCCHNAEDRMLETQDSPAASAAESFPTAESLNMLQSLEHHVSSLNKRNFNSEGSDNFEEFSQLSPTKKQRKKSSDIDGDVCKRCNCKKSKCLKLYCDCFAAGIYCADSCACQGCFNRPEYEDTVLETRQLIENRNPLAFAPKIVQHFTDLVAASRESRGSSMPSLSRHKRGCNCKKSMCLKKYCECYQSNVGCSSECRCEGCKNVYGRKEEYGMSGDMVIIRVGEDRLEGSLDDNLAMTVTNKDLLHAELYDQHNFMPSTPSFQHTDPGNGVPNSRFISSSRYVPSPGSDFPILPSYAKYEASPRNSHSIDTIPKKSKEIVEIDSGGQGIDHNISEMMGQFSPTCNALADVYDLTPLRNPSSVTIASSASSKTRDWTSGSRFQLCSGSGRFSSGGSLRWRSSPITRMTWLGETKSQGHVSASGPHNILEDDTPEILKEGSSPAASVKATSPNKKRVSPPHNRSHDFRSSSLGGLKSGHRFILKSVPSFPPLTPCINSEAITKQKQQQ